MGPRVRQNLPPISVPYRCALRQVAALPCAAVSIGAQEAGTVGAGRTEGNGVCAQALREFPASNSPRVLPGCGGWCFSMGMLGG